MAKVKTKKSTTILRTDSRVLSFAKKNKPTIIVVLMFTLLFVGLFFYMDKSLTELNIKNNELIIKEKTKE